MVNIIIKLLISNKKCVIFNFDKIWSLKYTLVPWLIHHFLKISKSFKIPIENTLRYRFHLQNNFYLINYIQFMN